MFTNDTVNALRDALRHSPDNLPLRQHLGEVLLGLGRADEAEQEYRHALGQAPDNPAIKVGLANAFYQQGKQTQALVVVEDVLKLTNPPARAHLLHARLLLNAGMVPKSVQAYRAAIELDPAVADTALAGQLGIDAHPEKDDVIEGKVRARAEYDEDDAADEADVERPKVTFKDVGGMEAIKDEIRMKIIHPLAHPELYQAYGKAIGGGVLMYGPPGCGKTHLARATAGEVKAGFIAVGISEVLDMWIGSSERNLHEVFEKARGHKPCVLFFDEVDALGASRANMHGHSRQLINQFLAEMDGINAANEGILILAATNAPWHLDPAFRRPGRFDRILFVPPPDAPARANILRILCRGKPIQDIDYDFLARATDHFSGADLKAVLDVAIEKKLREAIQAGTPKPLATKDLQTAAGTLRPTTKEWFSTARNYALYSNQGGLYDDILKYLKL